MDNDAQRSILVGVDGSGHSGNALRWAVDEARMRGTKVHVVRCWQSYVGSWATPSGAYPGAAWSHPNEAAEMLTGLDAFVSEQLGPGAEDVHIDTSVTIGNPAQVLVDIAEREDALMLVVGSRGMGGFRRLLLGSVSEQCATHAHCPVLIVRSPGD